MCCKGKNGKCVGQQEVCGNKSPVLTNDALGSIFSMIFHIPGLRGLIYFMQRELEKYKNLYSHFFIDSLFHF